MYGVKIIARETTMRTPYLPSLEFGARYILDLTYKNVIDDMGILRTTPVYLWKSYPPAVTKV